MIRSMTAFSSRTGAFGAVQWAWEMRGVNARGLDLRLRVPDGIEGLEPAVRAALTARMTRGNVSLSLRINREESGQGAQVDPAQLDRILDSLALVQARAKERGVAVVAPSAAEVLDLRGVLTQSRQDDDQDTLRAALLADLDPLLDGFVAMRQNEGAALRDVLLDQLARIEQLTNDAVTVAETRREENAATFRAALRRVADDIPEADPARLAQELAIIAVKQDVTEEIDRLRAHVAAARKLLDDPAPAGRKLDFLAQEFNREANTLCSKAQAVGLTTIGLDLKVVIDQMREQIQNVE